MQQENLQNFDGLQQHRNVNFNNPDLQPRHDHVASFEQVQNHQDAYVIKANMSSVAENDVHLHQSDKTQGNFIETEEQHGVVERTRVRVDSMEEQQEEAYQAELENEDYRDDELLPDETEVDETGIFLGGH